MTLLTPYQLGTELASEMVRDIEIAKEHIQMVSVVVRVSGGEPQTVNEVETVADVRALLSIGKNYVPSINGNPASDDDYLEENNFVSFSPSIKAGC